jgi:hypothetical protein
LEGDEERLSDREIISLALYICREQIEDSGDERIRRADATERIERAHIENEDERAKTKGRIRNERSA